ncbi:MAG TPA: hypothetical protein DCS67_06440 [Clostridiales bacterium UBA8960]|jgi:predicted metal-dependent hydrolase|nr:hypothetical protein [Clostridiales bacterium UBA8960]
MTEKSNPLSFHYSVIRSKRKTVTVSVNPVKGVIVRVPKNYRMDSIIKMLKQHEMKIVQTLEKTVLHPQGFEHGDQISYLGSHLTIAHQKSFEHHVPIVNIEGERLVIKGTLINRDEMIKAIEEWLLTEAIKILTERSEHLMDRLDVKPSKISFRSQKTRWGSCSSKGSISLNWKLVFAPLDVIDYVIIHEFCHLFHMNHSKQFWEKVASFDSSFKEHRSWLKRNAHLVYWPLSKR